MNCCQTAISRGEYCSETLQINWHAVNIRKQSEVLKQHLLRRSLSVSYVIAHLYCIANSFFTRRSILEECRRGSTGGEMGEFSLPFFWAPFFLSFFLFPFLIPYPLSLTLLQKCTPHFKILDPPLECSLCQVSLWPNHYAIPYLC